jgi:hypothetical protein
MAFACSAILLWSGLWIAHYPDRGMDTNGLRLFTHE